jgi:hypothetical protein
VTEIYDLLDAWWGERFGMGLEARLTLPLEQAISLYEHVSTADLPELQDSSESFALEPVVRPWVTEMHELNLAVAQARLTTATILGEVGAYGFVHYWGVHRFDATDPTISHPVGPFNIRTRENAWANLERRLYRLNLLAMYAHRLQLAIHDVLPRIPSSELPGNPRQSWLNDVNRRIALLALLRPLHSVGAITFGRPPGVGGDNGAVPPSVTEDWLIEPGEDLDLLENLEFEIEGNSSRIEDPRTWFRHWIAQNLLAIQLRELLWNATVPRGQIVAESPMTERALRSQIAGATNISRSELMRRFVDLTLPALTGNIAEVCAATYNLRRDSEIFLQWRTSVTDSLAAATKMVPKHSTDAELRGAFAEHLRPGIRSLQTEVEKQTLLRVGLKTTATGFAVGGMGLAGAVVAGDNVVQNAAGVGGATLGSALLAFLSSRRAKHSPEWDAYVALGLEVRK